MKSGARPIIHIVTLFCVWSALPTTAWAIGPSTGTWMEQLNKAEEATRAGRLVQADAMLSWLEQNAPPELTSSLSLSRAEYYVAGGNLEKASVEFARVSPDTADKCRQASVSGWIASGKRDWNKAILQLAWAVGNCPDDPAAWNLLGVALAGKGEYAASTEAFDTALAKRPDDPALLNNRALARIASGDLAAASTDLDNARTMLPHDKAIRDNADFLSGMRGQQLARLPENGDGEWAERLANAGAGARFAGRSGDATAYFADATLLLDHFNAKLWLLGRQGQK